MGRKRRRDKKEGSKRVLGKYDGLKYGWLMDTKKFIILFIVVLLVFRFVIGFSFVKGNSMLPTLKSGEIVMYFRLGSDYQAGDIVPVRVPEGEYYVKRVIATAGDTIDIKDSKVYLNGELLDEPYIQGETLSQQGAVRYPLTLKEDQIFVMGDNRDVSMDSRTFGVVGSRQIKGKILLHAGKYYIRKMEKPVRM